MPIKVYVHSTLNTWKCTHECFASVVPICTTAPVLGYIIKDIRRLISGRIFFTNLTLCWNSTLQSIYDRSLLHICVCKFVDVFFNLLHSLDIYAHYRLKSENIWLNLKGKTVKVKKTFDLDFCWKILLGQRKNLFKARCSEKKSLSIFRPISAQ